MRIERVEVSQAHPVPSSVYYPGDNIWDPEVSSPPTIRWDWPGMEEDDPYEPTYYTCNYCGVLVEELDLDDHVCAVDALEEMQFG